MDRYKDRHSGTDLEGHRQRAAHGRMERDWNRGTVPQTQEQGHRERQGQTQEQMDRDMDG